MIDLCSVALSLGTVSLDESFHVTIYEQSGGDVDGVDKYMVSYNNDSELEVTTMDLRAHLLEHNAITIRTQCCLNSEARHKAVAFTEAPGM